MLPELIDYLLFLFLEKNSITLDPINPPPTINNHSMIVFAVFESAATLTRENTNKVTDSNEARMSKIEPHKFLVHVLPFLSFVKLVKFIASQILG